MRYEARKKMKSATEGTLDIDYIQDQAFVMDSQASPFAAAWAQQEQINSQLGSLKDELLLAKKDQKDLREEHEALKKRFNELEGSATEEEIRHRFISCFKHDILGAATEQDYHHILKGNGYAHEGNCIRDAHLYGCAGGRTDYSAFEKIYGLPPGILRLEMDTNGDAISLLKRHATLLVDSDRPLPPPLPRFV